MNVMHLDPRNIGEISCGISAIKYLFFFFFCCAVKSSQKLMCSSKRKLITTTDIIYLIMASYESQPWCKISDSCLKSSIENKILGKKI